MKNQLATQSCLSRYHETFGENDKSHLKELWEGNNG